MQALDPGHLAKAHGQLAVIGVIHLHAVAALLLGHVASHVGGPQRGFEGGRPLGNMHQAQADGGHERPPFPHEVQALHGLAQALGNALGLLLGAVLQKDTELVTTQPRQGVAFA
ncbi:hypothetical protein D3C79_957440 [compost metagenome]